MTSHRISFFATAIALAVASIGSAQAAVFTEDFEGSFPAWESQWFGTQSTGRNYYCSGALNCATRGNNPDGLWLADSTNGSSGPIDVKFNTGFGDSLTSFKLDVAGYTGTTLAAYDKDNALIFSQNLFLTFGAMSDPGVYASYTITSNNGISHFTFSGNAAGNTSIDNLVATTAAVPEPQTYALMLAGLGMFGFMAKRRKV
nr:FxDxF family PEP-CTERM protein [uncultured Roseateles sp.]